jgi:hypothetical protein
MTVAAESSDLLNILDDHLTTEHSLYFQCKMYLRVTTEDSNRA